MDVFLLGSGFSKAAAGLPVVSELIEPLATMLDASLFPHGALLRDLGDLEAYFGYVCDEQPWLSASVNALNRAAFEETVGWLAATLFIQEEHALASPPPQWLMRLANQWHTDRAEVVSLNYDLIVEATARTLHIRSRNENQIFPDYRSLFPAALGSLASRYGNSTWADPPRYETFSLLKLHGSLNWAYSPQGVGDVPVYDLGCVSEWDRGNPIHWTDVLASMRDLEPLVVPPVTTKSALYGRTGWIRSLWTDAADALAAAERVVCIGYSMPPSDVQLRLLLGTNLADKSLVLVNTDTDTADHYARLFPRATIDAEFTGEDAIERFVDRYAR
jgi:hypothetical protein